MRSKTTHLRLLALIALAVLPYLNSIRNGYTIDDFFAYADNAFIRHWQNWPHLFDANYFTYSNEASYRPVCTASYFLDWAVWGAWPGGPHVTQVLLYAATVVALFFFYRGLTASAAAATLGAALFALHPTHSEVVNSLSFREDLQVGLLLPLSWLAYQRGRRGSPAFWFPAAWLCYALAVFAKEMAVIYPALAVLLEWALAHRPALGEAPAAAPSRGWRPFFSRPVLVHLAGLAVVSLLFLLMRFHWMKCPLEGHAPQVGGSWAGTLMADVKIQAHYLGQFFVPLRLFAYYPASIYTPRPDPVWFASLAALLALTVTLVRWRRSVFWVTGVLWWFISLAPVANLYPIYNPMAERYLYLPSIGLCLWAGWGLARALQRAHRRPLLLAIALASLVMAVIVWQRNPVWRNNVALWTATARQVPDHPTVLANLAAAHFERQEYDRVITHATRALELAGPNAAGFEPAASYLPLGCALYIQGDKARALAYFHAAEKRLPLRFDLDSAIYRNLALAYEDRNEFPAAAGYYEKALAIDPFRPQVWAKLAYARLRNGQSAPGREAWEHARQLDGSLPAFEVLASAVAQEATP